MAIDSCLRNMPFGLRFSVRFSHWDALPMAVQSHTLSVLSHEPETMLLPSGEKATEVTGPLCALCFSAFSSKDAAASTGAVRYGLRVGGCQC